MNKAKAIKSWREGGNNYVLRGNSEFKWVGYQDSVIQTLKENFGSGFNIVIWSSDQIENDYYCIPFEEVSFLFKEELKTSGKYPNRWTSTIVNHRFMMKSNNAHSVDITKYYGIDILSADNIQVEEDYFIENAKSEIAIRIGQSKFRNGVLKNYSYKCALTGIREKDLLIASHIIPWSHRKDYRGDISNGICLCTEVDSLFDKGYISFDENHVTLVHQSSKISHELNERLRVFEGKRLRKPRKDINLKYLEYHRREIFKG
ncbi:HNH endonuclease [Marinoscillum sp.]|uniref:HNH endonuclease n=1 Tax=Marinoscillum sp. TaxID=2024838 RepID=UPI003BAA083A